MFQRAHGREFRTGEHRCFYCGATCAAHNPTSQYVKDSFTGRDAVAAPGSQWVCDGCVSCLVEDADLTTHDGQQRTGQKIRGYSWVLTESRAVAATKADREFLRATCWVPPDQPYCIVISDSGQKHLLYRAPVNWSRDRVTVLLETERVTYAPWELERRIATCLVLIALTGKPALSEGFNRRQRMDIVAAEGEAALRHWDAVCGEPLTRMAIWLSPGKIEAIRERDASRAAGRTDG